MEQNKNDIYEAIYDIVRQVPAGRVTTFGHIAKAIGLSSGARLVGYALNNCHTAVPPVPAHRVLNRKGLLSGKHHFGAPDAMQKALEAEGVHIAADTAVDFQQLLWDPMQEISL